MVLETVFLDTSYIDEYRETGVKAMLIGYARVSTQEQNLTLQRDALTQAGCQRVFEDTVSSARADRPGFDEGPGDAAGG